MSSQSYKYWAFISYCHRDKKWGKWLHEALETYRVPKEMVGKTTERGYDVPARLYPVYRDREESPTAADLGQFIQNSLEQSRYLIVICSPHSARSRWVNEEIKAFKRLGRENRILSVIVDGEPNASDGKPGIPKEAECFPEALRFKAGSDGELTSERMEPVCGDVRKQGDGKENALLKLLAGVLGVNFDDLRQRERLRQRRRRFWLATGLLLTCVALACLQIRYSAIKREKTLQSAQAALANARKSLTDHQPALAIEQALAALNSSASVGRELEPAQWVLRRALDANLIEGHWQAHQGATSESAFDSAGNRLMTFSSDADEVRIWSVPGGRLLSAIKLAKQGAWLAGWGAGTNAVLTVSSTVGTNEDASVKLTWWNADNGSSLRTVMIDHCSNSDRWGRSSLSTGLPDWVVVHESRAHQYRLVRLRDGESKTTIPEPVQGNRLPLCVPACGIVLLPDQAQGVRLFALTDGRELGRLEGLPSGKDFQIVRPTVATDGKSFAGLVFEGQNLREVGVWRTADGSKVASYSKQELDMSEQPFMAAAPGERLLADSEKLVSALAAPLGRKPIHLPVYMAKDVVWSNNDSEALGAAVMVSRSGGVSLIHPELDLDSVLDNSGAEVRSVCFSPNGRWLATGDERGRVTIWRTSVAVQVEPGLPQPVQFVKPGAWSGSSSSGEALLQCRVGGDHLMIWDVAARKANATLTGLVWPENTQLQFVAWNPADALLVAVPEMGLSISPKPVPTNCLATYYDTKTGRILGQRPASTTIIAPHGKRALAWGKDYWEIVQTAENGLTVVPLVPAHPAGSNFANQAAFTPDGKQVVTAAGNGWLEVHSARTGASEKSFRFAEDLDTSINQIIINPSGQWALLNTYNHWWRLNLSTGQAIEVFANQDQPAACAFRQGDHIVVGNVGGELRWWKFPELTPIASVHGQFDPELTLSLDDTGELLLRQRYGGEICIADGRSGVVRSRFEKVLAMNLKASMAVQEVKNGAQLVRLSDGEVLADLPPTSAACIAADGSRVGLVLRDSGRFVSIPISMARTNLLARAQPVIHQKLVAIPKRND
ncbi:MAG: TIR domain-containing protein [Verrucomicrobiota bacterium]